MGKKQSRLRRSLQRCWHTTNESRMQGRVLLKVIAYTLRMVRNVEGSKRRMVMENEISDQSQGVKRRFNVTSVNSQVI